MYVCMHVCMCVCVCVYIYIYITESFAVHLKLTQHCKSTILQFKKSKKRKSQQSINSIKETKQDDMKECEFLVVR